MEKILNKDNKVVFFKLENDGSHSVTYDYSVIGESKKGSLVVIKSYGGRQFPNPKKLYIKDEFLDTTSGYWQETCNKPKYFVRIMPIEY